jgi:hypothetical protein
MMINFHSMEYYFQWHLIHYIDSLVAGPFAVCFLAEARDLLSIQHIRPALGTSTSYSVAVVEPSSALKHLMHETDHLSVYYAEVTGECSCNRASPECLHGVHRDNFTLYHCFGGMIPLSTWT